MMQVEHEHRVVLSMPISLLTIRVEWTLGISPSTSRTIRDIAERPPQEINRPRSSQGLISEAPPYACALRDIHHLRSETHRTSIHLHAILSSVHFAADGHPPPARAPLQWLHLRQSVTCISQRHASPSGQSGFRSRCQRTSSILDGFACGPVLEESHENLRKPKTASAACDRARPSGHG